MIARRLLIVEDEVLIGIVLEDILDMLGCTVVANCATLAEAGARVTDGGFDGAILDVNVAGEEVYGLADRLAASGTPLIFATGSHPDSLPDRFQGATILEKPYAMPGVEAALGRIFPD